MQEQNKYIFHIVISETVITSIIYYSFRISSPNLKVSATFFLRPISSTELSYTPVEDDRPGSTHCGHSCHCGHAPLAPPPLHCCPATRRAFSVNMNLAQEVKLILRELR